MNDKKEINQLKEQINNLMQKNNKLFEETEKSNEYKNKSLYYKSLVDCKFKECSALAEEVICLRTDLDRAHSNFLRLQREQKIAILERSQKSIPELEDTQYGLEFQDFEQQEEKFLNISFRSSTMKINQKNNSNFYSFSEKEPFKQTLINKFDDTEDDPPIPEQFKMLPISNIMNTSEK